MKNKRILWIVTGVVLLLVLAGIGVKLYSDHYIWFGGESISRESVQIDLRGKDVSASDFDALQAELPACEILWDVPFQGQKYPSTTQELQVSALTEDDLVTLNYFTELSHLDAAQCTDYEALLAFMTSRPECTVTYQITLGGQVYGNDTTVLCMEDPELQELEQGLRYLPELTRLQLSGDLPDIESLLKLRQEFPEVNIQWELLYEDTLLSSADEGLDLSGIELNYEDAVALLRWLPDAKTVDMRGCGLSDEEMMALCDANPQCFFLWEMTIGDVTVCTDAEEIDISYQVMQSTEEIESLLPYFPYVKKVVMSHCGLDDETMDDLNRRYEDIRFVWSIWIWGIELRTDITYFYPFKLNPQMSVDDEDLYPLRYCTDVIAVDIGHHWGVTNLEWAAFMPNLRYLIIMETQITDLTPLSGLKNLAYLEIFKTKITDYSPLLGCTGLEDLNMSKTYGDYTPITQMTWLKNLYWNGIYLTSGLPCSDAPEVLPDALPDTYIQLYHIACVERNGWRELENYKAMRDLMGMFYLP